MLDVHAPHSRISGFAEFFLHLFTITVGLLIATQIEACMEWRHHVHVAAEARASLHEEIEQNLNDLKDAQPGMRTWRGEVESDLTLMRRIQSHPYDPAAQQYTSLTLHFHDIALRDTAWKTAQSTDALAYMPYQEARQYAAIYKRQDAFLAEQQKPEEDVAELAALVNRFNLAPKAPITREQASEIAERLGRMKMHLLFLDMIMQGSIEEDGTFLAHRKPRERYSGNSGSQ